MPTIKNADSFSKGICDAAKKKEYSGLEEIVGQVFLSKDKLSILADLADSLPNLAFEIFSCLGCRD